MDLLTTFLLISILSLTTVLLIRSKNSRSSVKLPPGPKPRPIIGNLLDIGDKPHESLANLAKIHGPLMRLKLGQITTIVISSANLAQEVLQKQDQTFSNRTVLDGGRAVQHDQVSMIWLPVAGPWRNLRKICNSHIFTTQKLDASKSLRDKKIRDMLLEVEESCCVGKAVEIGRIGFMTALNALSSSLFSLDLTESDTAKEFKEVARKMTDEAGKPNLSDYFPVLKRFDVQGIRRRMSVYFQRVLDIVDGVIEERLRLRKAEDYVPVHDMLDTLLSLSEENSQESLDRNRIKHLFLDLLVAGTETTSNTLEWAMAELIRNPKMLSKAKQELDRQFDKGNALDESSIVRLPYLQAIIKETFRLHPPVPFLIPRKAGDDVELLGYTVPKGAQVIVNVWAMGRDPSLWDDPCSFMPERFLDSSIDVKGLNFELLPFGGGRRICPGLPLAIRLLHFMLGSLIHSFDWKFDDRCSLESLDMAERFSFTLQMAQPLRVIPIKV